MNEIRIRMTDKRLPTYKKLEEKLCYSNWSDMIDRAVELALIHIEECERKKVKAEELLKQSDYHKITST